MPKIVDRDWNPIVDYEEFTMTDGSVVNGHQSRNKGSIILIIFPKGAIRDLIKICQRNSQKSSDRHRSKNTILGTAFYYIQNNRTLSIEERASYSVMKRAYLDVFQLAEDIRVKVIRNSTIFSTIEVKVIFESTWESKHSIVMTYMRWTGALNMIRQFLQDSFQLNGTQLRNTCIQIIETHRCIEPWFYNSFEGSLFNRLLTRWGYFKESMRHVSRKVSSDLIDPDDSEIG